MLMEYGSVPGRIPCSCFWLEEQKKKKTTWSEWESFSPKTPQRFLQVNKKKKERLICVLMCLLASCLFIISICLFVCLPNSPHTPCLLHLQLLASLCWLLSMDLKAFSMHLKIFMNLNRVILLRQLSGDVRWMPQKPTYRVIFADSSIKVHLGSERRLLTRYWEDV